MFFVGMTIRFIGLDKFKLIVLDFGVFDFNSAPNRTRKKTSKKPKYALDYLNRIGLVAFILNIFPSTFFAMRRL